MRCRAQSRRVRARSPAGLLAAWTVLALAAGPSGLAADPAQDQSPPPPATTRQVGQPKDSQPTWWSLRPLRRPSIPESDGAGSGLRNPVDAFIRARLRAEGLGPSPEAGRRTLIRRVHFDLLGLPPAPEAVDAFEADPDPRAYEKLVDRLLSSPQYGERWARHWLDVVHYGDTHGYDKDKPRPNAWPYRDYVIRALNQDKPYGRFIQEQIAGDVLFPDTEDGKVALGFIAAGPWDLIGHAEVPESKVDGQIARLLDRDDMVANTFNTFCSLTIQCARCHNHKFDPVTQDDYYRLQAVFAALDRTDLAYDTDRAVGDQRKSLEARKRGAAAARKELEAQITRAGGKELEGLDKQIAEAKKAGKEGARPEFGWHSAIEAAADTVKWVQVDLGEPVAIASVIYVGCHDDFNNIGAGFGFPPRFRIEASDDAGFQKDVTVLEDQTAVDLPNPGVTPRRIEVGGKRARFVRMTATKLATRQNDYIFALAELSVLDADGKNVALGAPVTALDSIEAPPRWGRQNLVDGYYYGLKPKTPPAALAALEDQRRQLVSRVVDAGVVQRLEAAKREAEAATAELAKLPAPKLVYAGAVHYGEGAFAGTGPSGGKPRPIFVLSRGDVRHPGKEVSPGTVPFIPDTPSAFDLPPEGGESARRAALVRWLTDPRNPLTWRSIVNRVWQYHFGRGLVDSPNDFGHMGQQPSHPELLDWLAVEFRDGGQSLKQLHRLLLTSASYRQASTADTGRKPGRRAEVIDADNRLLWRMNRRKLEAEALRDTVLAVAGKLDLTPGGPAFQDFVIDKPDHSPHYEYDRHDPEDAKTHRRSIYRFLVRSQPQPFMTALDCADPSMSVERRCETLSPLQALALLNDKLIVAMSKHFAARVEGMAATPRDRVIAAFRLALARSPTPAEARALASYAKEHGLANACRVILNLNEFSFVD
jgi:hypothetical protein